ncbi:SWIM zinc finger family protein [Streptomyces sp. NPDC019990]|uniref:SWIM zinc finger family protein n=1 Tax=Streptomyces sp. NPDC019990 TaxID=3154693 RepID=UPI0033D2871A
MTSRPSDEARRALRAARERAPHDPDTAQAPRPAPFSSRNPADQGDQAPRRPADAAREALRRAVSEHRGGARPASDMGAVADVDEPADRPGPVPADAEGPAGPDGSGDGGTPGATPSGEAGSGENPSGEAASGESPSGEAGSGESQSGEAGSGENPSGEAASGESPSGEAGSGESPTEGSADEVDRTAAQRETTATGHGEDTGRPAPRAADIAREALRAAREEARRAREEAENEGARRRRGARQRRVDERAAAVRRSRDAAGEAPRDVQQSRDVRQLLSDAFRMPAVPGDPGDPDPAPAGAPAPASLPPPPSPSPPAGAAGGPAVPPGSADAAASGFGLVREGASRAVDSPRSSRAPHSMAAPSRDSELRRTFPALPPREPDGTGFAESWWGNAWVAALEQGALDAKRLERGRGYAGQGHVDAITVTPGLVLAYVRGSRPRPYRVQVRLRTLDEPGWERFLGAAADRSGHIAALLDKELPRSLADCGVPLLPRPGELEPHCSCPDRGHPCKHAAALCYQTARLLDADPFVLLLLRGRGERELLDALSRLSATRAARAAQDKEPATLPGVRATAALAPRAVPPLPAPLPPPPHPEQPPAYPASPGGPDPFALDQLATDAAARAHALLTTGRDPVGQLTLWEDAVRLAAARPGSGLTAGTRALYSSLASAAGRTSSELARAVAAWRQGGPEGLAVLEDPWDPPAGRFDRARPLLLAADLPAFRPWRNHLTHPHGHLQLRLGRDGLWYAYESEPGRDDWWPRGTPDPDPVGALTGLGIPGGL